jgi:hypothetical protein
MKYSINNLVYIGIIMLILEGCASSPARMVNLIPENIYLKSSHPYEVAITVIGGEETTPLSESKISNEAFLQALKKTIDNTHVFSKVTNERSGYLLEVKIEKQGMSLDSIGSVAKTVILATRWKLSKRGFSQSIWIDVISTKYTATFGDAFGGIKRVRLANEGAARNNIKKGLERISQLNLS